MNYNTQNKGILIVSQAMGTQSGNVHILDFNGNLNRTFKHHTFSINELSVDDCGEYIASCSNDGWELLFVSLSLILSFNSTPISLYLIDNFYILIL